MSFFSKLTGKAGAEIIQAADGLIDGVVTNQQERGQLKNGFASIFGNLQKHIDEQVTQRLKIDSQGSMLTKNIRPIILFVLVVGYMFSDKLGLSPDKSTVLGPGAK